LGGGTLFGAALLPKLSSAANARDPRLIVLVLRGALDGLSAIAPVGDPDYAALHGALALSLDGGGSAEKAALPLDSFFALNPGMPVFAGLYKKGQACVVHAIATGYRDRSHFDGQDILESGMPGPGLTRSGWLNRVLEALPHGEKANALNALAVGAATPLILRGRAEVLGWAPPSLPAANDDLAMRVMDLYSHADPELGRMLNQGLELARLSGTQEMGLEKKPRLDPNSIAGMRQAAAGAAQLIALDDGPRIAAMTFDGWDTHANEGGATGRLNQLLSGLDGAFEEYEKALGPKWKDTVIVAVTEFGRTVHINGTVGTDHGTGTVAFLAGGALKGGRVIADWPGLKPAQLYQERDLMPTGDLRAVLKGLLADQFGLSSAVLGTRVFPETLAIKPLQGLLA
jgi:uncharacterized protein (DUF1501 family)